YLGCSYRLDVRDADEEMVRLDGKFVLCGPRHADLKAGFQKWFVMQARQTIPPRADNYAQAMGVQYRDILISNMKYRWGSCTPANNLSFNWRLVKAPMHVIDYVVVHELAHLLEHNHSPRFWQHVKTQIPHFEACKAWLKDHGQCLEDEF
ncbi:MAG: M48 family metallopeptidase, partial [Rhodoplanes sp.]